MVLRRKTWSWNETMNNKLDSRLYFKPHWKKDSSYLRLF